VEEVEAALNEELERFIKEGPTKNRPVRLVGALSLIVKKKNLKISFIEIEVLEINRILKLYHFIVVNLMISNSVLWGKVRSLSNKTTKLKFTKG
jgi:hypothetical protein